MNLFAKVGHGGKERPLSYLQEQETRCKYNTTGEHCGLLCFIHSANTLCVLQLAWTRLQSGRAAKGSRRDQEDSSKPQGKYERHELGQIQTFGNANYEQNKCAKDANCTEDIRCENGIGDYTMLTLCLTQVVMKASRSLH